MAKAQEFAGIAIGTRLVLDIEREAKTVTLGDTFRIYAKTPPGGW
jgi:hypothetical protein